MARLSMKQVQSELEAARSMIEHQSQQLVLRDEQIARLKARLNPAPVGDAAPSKPTLSQFCKAYCREHGCTTVPGDIVRRARREGIIA